MAEDDLSRWMPSTTLMADLLHYRGRVVAVVGEKVVCAGDEPLAVLIVAQRAGYENPMIMKVRKGDGHAFIYQAG